MLREESKTALLLCCALRLLRLSTARPLVSEADLSRNDSARNARGDEEVDQHIPADVSRVPQGDVQPVLVLKVLEYPDVEELRETQQSNQDTPTPRLKLSSVRQCAHVLCVDTNTTTNVAQCARSTHPCIRS